MINIMNILNIELADYGITFRQVGIHSGAAIAGIIGHKPSNTTSVVTPSTLPGACAPTNRARQHLAGNLELVKHRFGAIPRGELE